ncbi:MAG: ankyrin repeat domain-containing protein [Gammaproteobacteria bacterium]
MRRALRAIALLAAIAQLFGPASALAASDVADAVMHRDSARLIQLISARADVNAAQPDGTTALHWAAYHGDTSAGRGAPAGACESNAVTGTGMTPLSLACEAGNADLVKVLLNAHADANQTLGHGETPLMMAARTGRVPVIELLLEHGAKLDARETLRGTTALMWAAANSNTDAVRLLISRGADVNTHSATTPPGRKPYLAESGRARIQEFIDGKGQGGTVVDVDAPDAKVSTDPKAGEEAHRRLEEERVVAKRTIATFPPPDAGRRADRQWGGLTPLLFAAREGSLDIVKVLLEAGVDVNQRSEFGWTALLVATHNRFYRLGSYLLEHGADPNLANEGRLDSAVHRDDNRNIEGGDYPTRKPTWNTSTTSSCCSQSTPTRICACIPAPRRARCSRIMAAGRWRNRVPARGAVRRCGVTEIVARTRCRSVDFDRREGHAAHGRERHWMGCRELPTSGRPQPPWRTVKLLLDLGADVNAQDLLDGRTALMGAAHKGRNDVIELLVQRGADLSLRDIGSPRQHSCAGGREVAGHRLRGRSRARRRAIRHCAPGVFRAPSQDDEGTQDPGAGRGSYARFDLRHRIVQVTRGSGR